MSSLLKAFPRQLRTLLGGHNYFPVGQKLLFCPQQIRRHLHEGSKYAKLHARSIADPQGFWLEEAHKLKWYSPPVEDVLTYEENGTHRWFKGAKLNTSYLCLDQHCEAGHGASEALVWDSFYAHERRAFTYEQLTKEVATFAGALQNQGVKKGDRVVIYMPMVWEAAVAMLACARLGAVHAVVFGGFAAKELAVRVDDLQPKVLVTADFGVEVTRVIPYKPLVDEALRLAAHPPEKTIILKRRAPVADVACVMRPGDVEWAEAVAGAAPAAPVPVDATDPLYVMYTSGTTGRPKGLVRDNGGHAVALEWSMANVYDCRPGDTMFTASDIGWVVGHSYIVYGPLLHRVRSVMMEGKPVGTPDAGTLWRLMAENRARSFFTAPTAVRAVIKEDPEGRLLARHDLSRLRNFYLAGERLDPATQQWLQAKLPGVRVMDHWWQTESGWPIVANPAGLEALPPRPGSPSVAMPGYDVRALDPGTGEERPAGELGDIVSKLPLPPGFSPEIWGAPGRFQELYLSGYPGYYQSGDHGRVDGDGYVYIMGRTDDVINVSGHRLSTGEMEAYLSEHPDVAECAVIGVHDPMKGEVPVGVVVRKRGTGGGGGDGGGDGGGGGSAGEGEEVLEAALVALVREAVGPVACFKTVIEVEKLPKTKSGKILRAVMKKMVEEGMGAADPLPPTIDDPQALELVGEALRKRGKLGMFA